MFRRGAARDLAVTVAEIEPETPKAKVVAKAEEPPKPTGPGQTVGLAVAEFTDAQKKELKLKGGVRVAPPARARRAPVYGRVMSSLRWPMPR